MASPPPTGPGPVVLASAVSIFLATIEQTTRLTIRSYPTRRDHNILTALKMCRVSRRGSSGFLRVALVDLTPETDSGDIDTFLDACEKKLGSAGDSDGHVAVPCQVDDADENGFMANEADFIAVFAQVSSPENTQIKINERCRPRLLKTLKKARQRGAVVIAVGQSVCRALGPNTHSDHTSNTTEEPPLVDVIVKVADAKNAKNKTPAIDCNWRDLTKELLLERGTSGTSDVSGLGLVPGGAALCFADGSVVALGEDAVTFVCDAKREKNAPPAFNRSSIRSGPNVFGGGVYASVRPTCVPDPVSVSVSGGKNTGKNSDPPPSAPPPPPELTKQAASFFENENESIRKTLLASHEWWPTWSGLDAQASASTERAARLLARPGVKNVVFFTGAGVSAESGMPAFRETVFGSVEVDESGEPVAKHKNNALDQLTPLWKKYDPEVYSTLQAFRANPNLCWSLHRYILESLATLAPNAAHVAIARMANHVDDDDDLTNSSTCSAFNVTVVTQNIDSLHQKAASLGRSPYRTLELHGSTKFVSCLSQCGWQTETEHFLTEWDLSQKKKESDPAKRKRQRAEEYPTCGGCGCAPAKPNCVLFGEALPAKTVADARAACANAQ